MGRGESGVDGEMAAAVAHQPGALSGLHRPAELHAAALGQARVPPHWASESYIARTCTSHAVPLPRSLQNCSVTWCRSP
uniref:Uncharacterized protein n=1 Tax=Arundo donax TaxID=35708 RepID=A0A0A9H0D3_ARUDO